MFYQFCQLYLAIIFDPDLAHPRESFEIEQRVSTTYIYYVVDVVIRSQLSDVLSARLFSRGASDMRSNGRFTVSGFYFNIALARETPRSGILLRDNALSLIASSLLLIFLRYDWTRATRSASHVEKTSSGRMLRSSDDNVWFLRDVRDVSPRLIF